MCVLFIIGIACFPSSEQMNSNNNESKQTNDGALQEKENNADPRYIAFYRTYSPSYSTRHTKQYFLFDTETKEFYNYFADDDVRIMKGQYSGEFKTGITVEYDWLGKNSPTTATFRGDDPQKKVRFGRDDVYFCDANEALDILHERQAAQKAINDYTNNLGRSISFGLYEQDRNYGNGKEPIQWIVLDQNGGRVLLMCIEIIDSKEYEHNIKTLSAGSTVSLGYAWWEESTIREWLNSDFYNSAFTDKEKKTILTTRISEKRTDGKTRTTNDKVFLLSKDELEKCLPKQKWKATSSLVAIENSYYGSFSQNGYYDWLLRSAEDIGKKHMVSSEGYIKTVDGDKVCGIRPAMWVSINLNDY